MSSSPYLSTELKDYLKKHKIETTLSDIVNDLLRTQVDDPYSYMMNQFSQLASNDVKIISVDAYETQDCEGSPTLKCIFIVEYKAKQFKVRSNFVYSKSLESQQQLFDGEENKFGGKGMNQAIEKIRVDITKKLGRKSCEQKQIDEELLKYFNENEQKVLNVTIPISYSVNQILANVFHFEPFEYFRQQTGFIKTNDVVQDCPKLIINLLQGSKIVGSKCKVFKFFLIVNTFDNEDQLQEIVSQITLNLRKAITSGKQGEAALKYHSDGTFICPGDTVADNLKLVEESIKKTEFESKVAIGISWQAEYFFNATNQKYEFEGPKQIWDIDQLIDYYFKLCTDKPIIQYFEDPVQPDDLAGLIKIINKFKDTKVKFGTRKIYPDLQAIKKLSQIQTKETHPDLTEDQIQSANNQKIKLNSSYHRLYDYPTFSSYMDYFKLLQTLNPSTSIIVGDSDVETLDTNIIDVAFSLNGCYLNLNPPLKQEKIPKYRRISEIIKLIKLSQKE